MGSASIMSEWVEGLQAKGYYTFTREQAESGTGRSFVATQSALRRLKEKGRIVSPRRGFYVVVPPEYRASSSLPVDWFVDDLMRHLDQPYYVGLLTAAAIHGAAHQSPMVFQVVTDRPTRDMFSGRLRIGFVTCRDLDRLPVVEKQTETGTMRVATPELTAFDLVRYPAQAGYWDNVATVLSELAESISARRLTQVASLVRLPDVQRLGFLLDAMGAANLAAALAGWIQKRNTRPVQLDPSVASVAENRLPWNVGPNVDFEVES